MFNVDSLVWTGILVVLLVWCRYLRYSLEYQSKNAEELPLYWTQNLLALKERVAISAFLWIFITILLSAFIYADQEYDQMTGEMLGPDYMSVLNQMLCCACVCSLLKIGLMFFSRKK